jgi:16S rRNA (cytidine1402-2'-O)-methyltransferase
VTTGSVGGSLVVVATPIGNLGDLSDRAKKALNSADVVCCEDTRRTRVLLSALGITSSPRRLFALHAHNEQARIPDVLGRLRSGQQVVMVTDAGTPAISDPGRRLVAAVAAAGLTVTEVPGPSAVTAALSVSGLPTDRFCFEGFLPRRGTDRRRRLEALATETRTTVLFEAPGRLAQLLGDLCAACGDRPVVVCRELTKLHEELWRGTLESAVAHFEENTRGEVVVVLGGAPEPAAPDDEEVDRAVASALASGASPREAADAVGVALGVPRRRAYQAALARRTAAQGPPEGSSAPR